jgi:PKD repeat protein
MNRLLTYFGLALSVVVAIGSGCTREESPAAKPTATAAVAATAQTSPHAAASPAAVPEELYVDLEAEPDEGEPPLTVKFTSSVEDGTAPFTYKWDFGDGSPAGSEANPTHVYAKEGEYTATLTVKDSKGIEGSEEVDVLVERE